MPKAGIAEDIGRNLLVYGRRMPKAELFARIDAVDSDTIKGVANRFIMDEDVAIAALGDTQVCTPKVVKLVGRFPDVCWVGLLLLQVEPPLSLAAAVPARLHLDEAQDVLAALLVLLC